MTALVRPTARLRREQALELLARGQPYRASILAIPFGSISTAPQHGHD